MAHTADIKICFVGLGSIGQRHVKNLTAVAQRRHINIQIDALRHTNSGTPKEISTLLANQYFNSAVLGTYDWIFICNPSQNHYDTLKALKGKAKYFFIEKPVFTAAISQHDVESFGNVSKYYVACPLRYKAVYREIVAYIKSHKIYGARIICSSYLPEWRPNVDYRVLYSAKKESGGVKLDLIHEFDYMIDLFGFPKSSCLYEGKVSNLEVESCDVVSFIGQYPDKLVEMHLDYFGRKAQRYIELFSTDETKIFDFLNDDEDRNASYTREIEAFVDIATSRYPNVNDLARANNVLNFITNQMGDRNVER